MKILVGFECSQVVCSAFRAAGHTAYSCDIKPCAGTHLLLVKGSARVGIRHPPKNPHPITNVQPPVGN